MLSEEQRFSDRIQKENGATYHCGAPNQGALCEGFCEVHVFYYKTLLLC